MSVKEIREFESTVSLPNRDFRHYRKMLIINLNNINDEALIKKHTAVPFDKTQPILEWKFEDGTIVTLQLVSDSQEYWGEVKLRLADGTVFKGAPLLHLKRTFIQEIVVEDILYRYVCIFDPIGMSLFD